MVNSKGLKEFYLLAQYLHIPFLRSFADLRYLPQDKHYLDEYIGYLGIILGLELFSSPYF